MAIKTYSKSKDGNKQLSKNFKVREMACKCSRCSTVPVDEELVGIIQKIRDHFGVPVNINSGYRCPAHNAETPNSSKNSRHMKGMAADIVVKGVKPREVAKYAESIGVRGIGLYETDKDGHFVHVDTRSPGFYWYGQAGKAMDTFGGAKAQTFTLTMPVLKKGMRDDTVQALQLLLQGNTNARLVADGSFGPATELEVKEYQRKKGLTADGVCGPATWKRLLGV